MKKGLLTVLLASLVLVGCQNYDDQFDDLNAQISALKSQVDGLSSLSGQVSSLSGSISGLQAGVSAAQAAASSASSAASAIDLTGLSASLATLQAEVDAVQASLATAATASAVAALQAEIDAIEADVDELLATSNVYTPPGNTLTIGSSSQLDAAVALGNNINIVNGSVDIDVTAAMDATKVQSVIDKIFTVTSTFSYAAATSAVTAMTFDKLASTGDLDVKQAGDYSFKALATAGTITLDDAYASKVTSIDLGALTTVTGISTNVSGTATANTISFSSATNVDLASLAYYTNATMSITTKKDATLDISSLDDKTSTGTATDYSLTFNGPKTVSISNMESYSGAITASNVENLTLTGFKGIITVGTGVENLTVSGAEQFVLNSATKLQTVDVEVVAASDPSLTATVKAAGPYGGAISAYTGETPALSFASMPDLDSVKLSGLFRDLSFASLGNLTSIDIDAEFEDLSITDNDDLTTLDFAGAKFGDLTLTGNDNLVTANFGHTLSLNMTGSATDDTNVAVTVQNNTELTSLTWGGSTISNLDVTSNAKLATINFSAVTAMGADTTPTVDVYSNNLVASSANDEDDGTTDYSIDGTNDASDAGLYTSTSGMSTLAAFLTVLKGKANANAAVHFDKVTLHTIATGGTVTGETAGEQNTGNVNNYATEKANDVTLVFANTASTATSTTTGNVTAAAERRAFIIDVSTLVAGTSTIALSIGGTTILHTGSAYGNYVASSQNLDLLISEIKSSQAVSRAADLGATLDVYKSANSTMAGIEFAASMTSASGGNLERYTDAQVAALYGSSGTLTSKVTSYDSFVYTVGGRSVTVTLTLASGTTSFTGQAAANAVADQVGKAWDVKYGTDGSVSGSLSFWAGAAANVTATTADTIDPWALKSVQSGSRGYGQTTSFVMNHATAAQISTATSGAITNTYLDWKIGATDATTDNGTTAVDLILSLTETTEDAIAGANATITALGETSGITELTTAANFTSGALTTTLVGDIFPDDPGTAYGSIYSGGSGDATRDEAANEGVTTTGGAAQIQYSRIHWLT